MRRFKRIMVASDLSKVSRGAFNTAIEFAASRGAELFIVHVIAPISPLVPEQFIQPGILETIEADARRWAERQLQRLAAAARKSDIRVKALLLSGDPADQIIRAARAHHTDLIVVGTHGRRGFSKMMLGSVAEHVLRTAPCPVVTVRRQKT
jgi:nucleotide-binding universal stress UspA family protein